MLLLWIGLRFITISEIPALLKGIVKAQNSPVKGSM
jgi:hypothetical protein